MHIKENSGGHDHLVQSGDVALVLQGGYFGVQIGVILHGQSYLILEIINS